MNILYEEDGNFKVGSIMADNTTSLQVENVSGKRSKVKAANVMLRFAQPALAEFLAQAEALAETIEVDFLWECCPPDEFGFEQIAAEYFGHAPSSLEAAAALIRLHGAPIYFHKKGKGRYRAAPPDVLKAALAGAEKKRQQLALQARYTEQLCRFELPSEFAGHLAIALQAGSQHPRGQGAGSGLRGNAFIRRASAATLWRIALHARLPFAEIPIRTLSRRHGLSAHRVGRMG